MKLYTILLLMTIPILCTRPKQSKRKHIKKTQVAPAPMNPQQEQANKVKLAQLKKIQSKLDEEYILALELASIKITAEKNAALSVPTHKPTASLDNAIGDLQDIQEEREKNQSKIKHTKDKLRNNKYKSRPATPAAPNRKHERYSRNKAAGIRAVAAKADNSTCIIL